MQLHGGAPAGSEEACPLVVRPENLTYRGFRECDRYIRAGAHRLPTGGSVVGLPWVAQRYVGSLDMEDKGSDFEVAAGRSETAAAVVIGL